MATVPLVGPAMQIFQFIFLKAKGWETDSAPTGIQLTGLATRAAKTPDKEGKKLSLLVYPEGTLVSKLTRPGSKRFADRKGIVRRFGRTFDAGLMSDCATAGFAEFTAATIDGNLILPSNARFEDSRLWVLRYHDRIPWSTTTRVRFFPHPLRRC